ncbi:MAG: alpha/beta hydrolase family protein [Reyranellales bacterium]|jgi:dienelactone hydrolase
MKTILGILLCLLALPALAQSPGPQGPEGSKMREQEWRIPGPGGVLMDATVFRPPGNARAPLMVMNHGSPASSSERPGMKRPQYTAVSSFFVSRGYVVVLPLRRGYGATGGPWAEDYGRCNNPDYFDAGLKTAADIRAAIDFMRQQPFVAPDRTLVVGQSAGAWGTVAMSSLNPPGVSAMIAFAPGRGGHQPGVGNCEPSALVKTAGKYGATARVPLLWVNAANDTFFEPKLVDRMVAAYTGAGGQAVHRSVAAFGNEGHNLASSDGGAPIWHPLVEGFLQGK